MYANLLNLISYSVAMTSLLYILRNKRINLIVDLILFEMNDKRSVVKFYYEQNFSPSEIFELLENNGFNRMFIHRTIKRLNETGSVADRKRSRSTPQRADGASNQSGAGPSASKSPTVTKEIGPTNGYFA